MVTVMLSDANSPIVGAIRDAAASVRMAWIVGSKLRGLAYSHWRTVIGADCFIKIFPPTKSGEQLLSGLLSRRGAARVSQSLGAGTFSYEGLQGATNPQATAWRFKLYGGLVLGGDDPTVRSEIIGAITGPVRVKQRADLALKWLERRGAG